MTEQLHPSLRLRIVVARPMETGPLEVGNDLPREGRVREAPRVEHPLHALREPVVGDDPGVAVFDGAIELGARHRRGEISGPPFGAAWRAGGIPYERSHDDADHDNRENDDRKETELLEFRARRGSRHHLDPRAHRASAGFRTLARCSMIPERRLSYFTFVASR